MINPSNGGCFIVDIFRGRIEVDSGLTTGFPCRQYLPPTFPPTLPPSISPTASAPTMWPSHPVVLTVTFGPGNLGHGAVWLRIHAQLALIIGTPLSRSQSAMRRSQGAATRDTVVARLVPDPGPCVSGGPPSLPTLMTTRMRINPTLVSPTTTAGTPLRTMELGQQFGVTPWTGHVLSIATQFQVCSVCA